MTNTDLHPEVTVDRGITVIELGAGFQSVDERALDSGLRTSLLEMAESADPPVVLLDLSHTNFFGSSFIEILFRLWNRLNAKPGGNFAICGLTSYCLEVLKITHLDTLWRLYDTRDEALRDMMARPA
jgi:anti-anti-sigma factor